MTRLIFCVFLHLQVRGVENLKGLSAKNGVIFAVNHSSELDPILIPASLPFLSPLMPMFYTSRERSFYKNSGWRQYFYGGFLFEVWGSHALHSGKHNYEISLSTHIGLLKAGKSLCIFPEGRKTRDGQINLEAHGGVAYLCHRMGTVVIPVHINGAWNTSFGEFILGKRRVSVSYGRPMAPKKLLMKDNPAIEDFKEKAGVVMRKIARL